MSPAADVRPLRIAHLASLHVGEPTHDRNLLREAVERVVSVAPDLLVVAGDLTAAGYEWEYADAARELEPIAAPRVVVPGNHDSKNVGYVHHERYFHPRFDRLRLDLDADRAEVIGAAGVTVVGLDSSQPDLDEGHIGRERYDWLREQFAADPADLRIVVLHHHLIAVPGAGRDINVVTDAGDLLAVLDEIGVDLVLTGHKHVPAFWGLNGAFLVNAGTVSTRRTRGRVPPSWNELEIDRDEIRVHLHYEDGRRELSAIRKRASRTTVREAFHLTGDFLATNALPPS